MRAVGRLLVVIGAAVLLSACRTTVNMAAVEDAQLSAQVKTALINDPDLGSTVIEVSVVRGVARLAGRVRTEADIERARTLARSVPGVRDVQVDLQVAGDLPPPPTAGTLQRQESRAARERLDMQADRRLLAVGAALGWSGPRVSALEPRVSAGPLVRLGSGRGFGPALALNWFQTTLADASPGPEPQQSRIYVRPLMGGVSYTLASSRLSISPSMVAGVAFNSLTAPTTGEANRIAVEVGNSLIYRPGVSLWFDASTRAAINVSAGYAVTQLRVTFLQDGRLVRRRVRGDTAIVQAGIAYKLF